MRANLDNVKTSKWTGYPVGLALVVVFLFSATVRADAVNLYSDKNLYMDTVEAADWIFGGFDQVSGNKSPRIWEFSMLLSDGDSSTGTLTMSDYNGAGGLMQAPQGGDGTMTFWHNSANMYDISFGDADFVNSFYMDIAPHSSWSAAINFAVTADYWLNGVKYTTDAVTVDMYNSFFGIILDEGAYLEAINFGSTGTPNNGYKIEAGFGDGDTVIELIPAVPEPATLTLVGLGLAGLGGWVRARRKK